MKLNCKPGDMAIVISASLARENIGRIVEVARQGVNGVDYQGGSGAHVWMVRSSRPLARAAFGGGYLSPSHEAACYDANLRPITGLPVDEEAHDEVAA